VALFVADKVDKVCDEQNDNKQSTFEEKNKNKKKKSVLIVEDNNDLQNFLKHSLQSMYDIYVANDGVEAWNTIQKKSPDLIISDVMMPNRDGFELCKLVKSTFETSHIPLILLTALSDKTKQLEGLGLGADDYITKPFDVSLLRQRIITIVSNREIIREKALKLIRQNDNEQPIINNELNDKFVKKALKIVRDNIANSGFGKDEFASAMFVSSSLLYKKMKSLTNQSPSDFIKTIRLDYALELLKSHKYTVTEISELSGFSSINYFSRTFKSYFGRNPTDI
jgi:CheY-like chemotaxis protein